ncbi:hypothetical protein SEPCBS119000_006680 [Sporothrix epigloea]|uniref:Uncharacterized protein n=1 Tax=Sporothrix epigloea TaxID=1892477 RepID=A0ABP0E7J4_9PEZI
MQILYATGFNAWGQLQMTVESKEEPDDFETFTRVLDARSITLIRPSLTYTMVVTSERTVTAGVLPVANATGYLHIAEALNGRVVVHNEKDGALRQYQSVVELAEEGEFTCFPGFPDVVQIVAYSVGFAVLTTGGCVWTWGDARFPECLGRAVSQSPAHIPGRVTALEDLPTGPIVKLAAGGYVLAALTKGHDLYCWGGYPGQQSAVLDGLTGEPVPVIVSVGATDRDADQIDEAEIVDVGVGENHMIVLTADGTVCGIGSNGNGQLGLGRERQSAMQSNVSTAWTKVSGITSERGERVTGVYAGPRSSFIVVTRE